MSTVKDGGPAFPAQPIYRMPDGAEIAVNQGGMTLRDYFAAKAMQGIVSVLHSGMRRVDLDSMALDSYAIADAMLKARSA